MIITATSLWMLGIGILSIYVLTMIAPWEINK